MSTGVVLAGLPATGKTSYLALLYHAIVVDRADGLRLGRFDDDREHITEVSDRLLTSNVAEHTQVDDDQHVSLSLTCDGDDFELVIPDLSGETWEHALVDRRWSKSLDETIRDAAGFMVFVHCRKINGGLTIVDATQAAAALADEPTAIETPALTEPDAAEDTPEAADPEAVAEESHEFEEQHCKQLTEVSLVELIQFFTRVSFRPIRMSIVISAWDLAPSDLTPADWVARNARLLDQFLAANPDEVEAKVWGVSAQGADLADPKVREMYKDKDPIERARVHHSDGTATGISAPLRWVLRLDQ